MKILKKYESFEPEEDWEEELGETDLRLVRWADGYYILEKITDNGVILYNNYNHYIGNNVNVESYFSYVNNEPKNNKSIYIFSPDINDFVRVKYGDLEESIKNRILYN